MNPRRLTLRHPIQNPKAPRDRITTVPVVSPGATSAFVPRRPLDLTARDVKDVDTSKFASDTPAELVLSQAVQQERQRQSLSHRHALRPPLFIRLVSAHVPPPLSSSRASSI
jgi:hypothetical protein